MENKELKEKESMDTLERFPAELLAQHIAIVGKTGSGKTYTAKGFVERLLTDKRRVCILDPTGVWYGLRSSADGKKPGFAVAVFGGRHADVAIAEHSGAALAKIVAEKNLPAIIDLSEMLIGQRHRFVTDFAEALYRDNRAPLHLVIDEADEFAPQNPLPETKRMLHHVDRIVRRGRVRGFRVMLITQRPAVLHKNVLTQANALIAMRLTAPQDRKAIQAWVEGQADANEAREVLASLAKLQRGEGWVWAPELGLLNRTTFPKITTFDSGRTPDDDEVIVEPSKLATVDLAEVRASMDVVEQEFKSVKELQAELARVKQQLAASQVSKGGIAEAEVQRRIREAVAAVPRGVPAGNMIGPKLGKAIEKMIDAALVIRAEMGGFDARLTAPAPRASVTPVAHAPRQREAAAPVTAAAGVDGLRSGAVRILQELAARSPAGYSRPQVGALTQFSHKGGTFGTYFSDLRRAGFIEERSGLVYATDAGIRALGSDVPPTPKTHAEVMTLWRRALRSGAFAMLEAVVEEGHAGMSREQLAASVGMVATGGTFGTYLSDLRRNGLITERDRRVFANDILFPK
jgi:hypothetical protein